MTNNYLSFSLTFKENVIIATTYIFLGDFERDRDRRGDLDFLTLAGDRDRRGDLERPRLA